MSRCLALHISRPKIKLDDFHEHLLGPDVQIQISRRVIIENFIIIPIFLPLKLSYFYNRFLRWAGHVERMPMSRAPRQLLTSWVAHSRPVGCPQMTWGRTLLENALKRKGISKEFDEWFAIAKDRPKWRQLTHSNPKPPDA